MLGLDGFGTRSCIDKAFRFTAVRLGLIFFVVVLLIGAFATDPKPVYNKATELLAADEWPAMNELPPDSDSTIVVEGGSWATELHAAVEPSCDRNTTKQLYPKPIARTALATFPRSGNTFIRTMVERAT